MNYIVHRRFKRKGIDGEFNLPYGTKCQEKDGVISCMGRPICLNTSQIAKEHFAIDDGNGLERGEITYTIAFSKPLTDKQKELLRNDNWLSKFIRDDCKVILFNDKFFNATIMELREINRRLEVK